MSTNNGGPAFPAQEFICGFDEQPPVMAQKFHYGMSMRDYLAAKAMQGRLAAIDATDRRWMQQQREYDAATKIAQGAYVMADAMLKAREQS
jgi:hypothetical protein